MQIVEFESVSKSFAGRPVLQNIDLGLPADRITAVVGESGSGKSTLLEHINGLLRPDTGTVRVSGRPLDYENLLGTRRATGYAVQRVGLFPHLTVFQNITLLARLAEWPVERVRDRARTLMKMMDLPQTLEQRYPNALSGGQQQRAGICRALMLGPSLVLLDEPFSGVDPITRRGIHEEFLCLHAAEGGSVILVTHDMQEARRLASHLVVLRSGVVEQAGPLEGVVREPATDYVGQLIADDLVP